MRPPAQRIDGLGTTVFSEFSALALQHAAVNLGQGFPDFDGPEQIREAAARAMRDGVNQYAISFGAKVLREAIAAHAKRFYKMDVDVDKEITVTSGATEALFDAVLGLVNPGDEVVLFEPFYDSYWASVQLAGGVARCVRLQPPDASHEDWWFDAEALAAAFSPRTRLVILNTPHNPTGKVFNRQELEQVALLCVKHDALLLSDEVYEHLVYAGAKHIRPATLPALADRTVTVSSGGKTFGLTGWKIGWAIAPPVLTRTLRSAHQFVTFATASPLQAAIAEALVLPDAYFENLARDYCRLRDHLVSGLRALGIPAGSPNGAYFAIADLTRLGIPDLELCRTLTRDVGVAAIPLSPFYDPKGNPPQSMVRFAFCKKRETLDAALQRLRKHAARFQ